MTIVAPAEGLPARLSPERGRNCSVSVRLQAGHRNRGSSTVTLPNSVAMRCPRQSFRWHCRRRTGNTVAAAHGCRPAQKPPRVERSPEPASLRVRSNPGSRCRQDLPAGRSPIRSVLGQRSSSPVATATPIAFAFPRRLSTRPSVPLVSSSPHSQDTPLRLLMIATRKDRC
jgi:hypothetical protein